MVQLAAAYPLWHIAAQAGVIILKLLLCVLIADLLSGVAHWLEDSYGSPSTPVLGKFVIEPNILHHSDPRAFLKTSYWSSMDVPLVIAALALLAAWLLGCFHWTLVVVLALVVHSTQFHKWSHRSRTENGPIIVALQQLGLIQTPAHHAGHHRGGKDRRYCVVTNYTNLLLDGIGLWRGLEWMLLKVFGLKKRPEPWVDGHDH